MQFIHMQKNMLTLYYRKLLRVIHVALKSILVFLKPNTSLFKRDI